ncbi:hypothetical protein C5C04_02285 [Rathayibacter rathayi]|uniref:Uncharacterized protein n=2 Tax=Rathayibacter rathayi TaxID=33887 RepID=A0ABD6WB55_RATRA|nr:hypothetical protein C5C04_02285 [Rathayibacter rathayi]
MASTSRSSCLSSAFAADDSLALPSLAGGREVDVAAFKDMRSESTNSIIGWIAVVAITGLLVVGIGRRRLAAVLIGAGTILLSALIIVGAGLDLRSDSVRYVVFLLPALSAAGGWLFSRWRPAAIAAVLLATALTASGVWVRSEGFRLDTSERFDDHYTPVVTLLERRGVEHVYGDYWLSYALTASTDEEITVAAFPTSLP